MHSDILYCGLLAQLNAMVKSRLPFYLPHAALFRQAIRATWFSDWKRKVDCVLQKLLLEKTPEFELLYSSGLKAFFPNSLCFILTLEFPRTSVSSFYAVIPVSYVIRMHYAVVGTKSANKCGLPLEIFVELQLIVMSFGRMKTRAWGRGGLYPTDGYGLSKAQSDNGFSLLAGIIEDQLESNQPNQWLMQPSYKTKYLLLTQGGLSSKDSFSATGQLPSFPHESLESEWETANRYHFKSMASVHVLRHICLNFHKDFTLEQVNRSGSFLDHLIEIQQQQRAAAYGLADQLTRLRRCSTLFENLFSSSFFCETVASSECYFAQNQHTTYICMWPQKDLLDNLLLGRDSVLTSVTTPFHPYVISKQMEQFVSQNF
ncbi:hypothetical protein RHSIM_Rhsim04G0127600 [Rhododendron simsii]|uniref:Uncharacterized protein n=1 Tax=Rhododendron simsii TaxID=118357 RepID=A0A834LP28_RHOSS|nr:hypothetical protein RHSIM_Rhsim04G0127600 [Rhododendron simsii]